MFDAKEKQAQVRKELGEYMWDNPHSVNQWAKMMGISPVILGKFIKGGSVSWPILAKISNYLKEAKLK